MVAHTAIIPFGLKLILAPQKVLKRKQFLSSIDLIAANKEWAAPTFASATIPMTLKPQAIPARHFHSLMEDLLPIIPSQTIWDAELSHKSHNHYIIQPNQFRLRPNKPDHKPELEVCQIGIISPN